MIKIPPGKRVILRDELVSTDCPPIIRTEVWLENLSGLPTARGAGCDTSPGKRESGHCNRFIRWAIRPGLRPDYRPAGERQERASGLRWRAQIQQNRL